MGARLAAATLAEPPELGRLPRARRRRGAFDTQRDPWLAAAVSAPRYAGAAAELQRMAERRFPQLRSARGLAARRAARRLRHRPARAAAAAVAAAGAHPPRSRA